jgi:hypothetical protein
MKIDLGAILAVLLITDWGSRETKKSIDASARVIRFWIYRNYYFQIVQNSLDFSVFIKFLN